MRHETFLWSAQRQCSLRPRSGPRHRSEWTHAVSENDELNQKGVTENHVQSTHLFGYSVTPMEQPT